MRTSRKMTSGLDEGDGLDAVGAVGEYGYVAGGVEEVLELLARERLVVDDQRGERCCHGVILGCAGGNFPPGLKPLFFCGALWRG
jgi:hypothetical protein